MSPGVQLELLEEQIWKGGKRKKKDYKLDDAITLDHRQTLVLLQPYGWSDTHVCGHIWPREQSLSRDKGSLLLSCKSSRKPWTCHDSSRTSKSYCARVGRWRAPKQIGRSS